MKVSCWRRRSRPLMDETCKLFGKCFDPREPRSTISRLLWPQAAKTLNKSRAVIMLALLAPTIHLLKSALGPGVQSQSRKRNNIQSQWPPLAQEMGKEWKKGKNSFLLLSLVFTAHHLSYLLLSFIVVGLELNLNKKCWTIFCCCWNPLGVFHRRKRWFLSSKIPTWRFFLFQTFRPAAHPPARAIFFYFLILFLQLKEKCNNFERRRRRRNGSSHWAFCTIHGVSDGVSNLTVARLRKAQ